MITLTALRWVPDFARGLVRDLRVRWALEEAGLDYRVRLVGPEEQSSSAYRSLQPFGQVPAFQEGDLVLHESGAIVLHIGAGCELLLPRDTHARARAVAWVVSALNSVETFVQPLAEIDLFHEGEAWIRERRPMVEQALRQRLMELQTALGDGPWLEGTAFTAGDLMMVSVLRILRHTDILADFPPLTAYVKRATERPAFQRALAAQDNDFAQSA